MDDQTLARRGGAMKKEIVGIILFGVLFSTNAWTEEQKKIKIKYEIKGEIEISQKDYEKIKEKTKCTALKNCKGVISEEEENEVMAKALESELFGKNETLKQLLKQIEEMGELDKNQIELVKAAIILSRAKEAGIALIEKTIEENKKDKQELTQQKK